MTQDAALVLRIGAGGDSEAEAELFHLMAPRVRLYGLRHLRDEDAADDLVQQALLAVLEALREGRLRDPEKLSSFVLGTCRMTVQNLRRSVSRKQQLLAQFGGALTPAPAPGPRLDHKKLADCVQGLRERERTVIVMTFYDERTSADVGGLLGLTESNVRVVRHRAIRSLRRCMGVAE